MSVWTHVGAVIRVDAFRGDEREEEFTSALDDLVGKECEWESPEAVWEEAENHPERFMPIGSEGGLEKHLIVNPNASYLDAYTIVITGDLRDYADGDKIIEWFKSVVNKIDRSDLVIGIRLASITVNTEYGKSNVLVWGTGFIY